ncbi:MAG TPA: hypothetical protein VF647_22165, partial [Longimicrobium sp.]
LFFARAAPSGVARGWSASAGFDGGTLLNELGESDPAESATFIRPRFDLGWVRRWTPARAELEAGTSAGIALGELPRQALFLVGGRGTIPGFPFRAFGGDRFALARVMGSADVAGPWLRGRGFANAGWTGVGSAGRVPLQDWGAATTGSPRFSVGTGVGLFYDILRVDVARGLGPDGRWELIVEANPSFWDFL